MKKAVLMIAFTLFGMVLFSQNEVKVVADTTKYTYCDIIGTGKFMSNKMNVVLDFGQFRSIWTDNRVKDPVTGERIEFNSMIDALNYMAKNRWEFVQAYVITTNSNGSTSGLSQHYICKIPTRMLNEDTGKK